MRGASSSLCTMPAHSATQSSGVLTHKPGGALAEAGGRLITHADVEEIEAHSDPVSSTSAREAASMPYASTYSDGSAAILDTCGGDDTDRLSRHPVDYDRADVGLLFSFTLSITSCFLPGLANSGSSTSCLLQMLSSSM